MMGYRYLDFLSVVFWSVEHKQKLTQALFNDQRLCEELRATTWEKYSIEIAAEYEQMVQTHFPRYWRMKQTLGIGRPKPAQAQPQVQPEPAEPAEPVEPAEP